MMQRRTVLVLVLASLAGLVASLIVYRVIVQGQSAGRTVTEQVVVAAVNMELAETVTSSHVKLVAWPKDGVPVGAIRKLAEAEGRVVRSSIVAGEPLLDGKLAPQLSGRGGIMPMLVPEGQRGLTIRVDDAIKESGFVLPNSRVDVLVSIAREANSQERVAKLILQDVLVLAAGQAVEMRDNKPVPVTTVTLSLTPEQAERLTLAQHEGRLMLGTRNLRDKGLVQTTGVTRETLLKGQPAATVPAPVPVVRKSSSSRPKPVAPAPPPPPTVAIEPLPVPKVEVHGVSVLRSGRISEHTFVRSGEESWVEQKEQKK
jgi:pilus assembly protein CpaB